MRLKKKATVARKIRRMHSPELKASIALEALQLDASNLTPLLN